MRLWIKSTPNRRQGFRVFVKPRFALWNHTRQPYDDFIITLVFDDNGSVREMATKGHAALGIGGFVADLSKGSHLASIANRGLLAKWEFPTYRFCLCLRTSYKQIPLATETFKLSTLPNIGIRTVRSHNSRVKRRRPVPSAPRTRPIGPLRSA